MDFTLQKHHEFDLSSDSEHLIKRPLKEINDPERLKGVIGYVEDTEEQMVDLDDEGVRSTFGFTRLQRKHLLSDLKKRYNDLVRKR